MAQERPLSPEKQLLRLIEEPKSKSAGIRVQTMQHIGLSFLSVGAWSGRISFFKEKLKKYLQGRNFRKLDVKIVNAFLVFCIVIISFYFVNNMLFFILSDLKKGYRLNFNVSKQTEAPERPEADSVLKKAASYYVEKVRERDIFKMGAKNAIVAGEASAPTAPSLRIIEATQYLRLVGISWSNNPDAMIEDTKALRTLFVTRGQMIGDIKVRAILKDKVILSYGTEEIELE